MLARYYKALFCNVWLAWFLKILFLGSLVSQTAFTTSSFSAFNIPQLSISYYLCYSTTYPFLAYTYSVTIAFRFYDLAHYLLSLQPANVFIQGSRDLLTFDTCIPRCCYFSQEAIEHWEVIPVQRFMILY
jgi:hypothetical protein